MPTGRVHLCRPPAPATMPRVHRTGGGRGGIRAPHPRAPASLARGRRSCRARGSCRAAASARAQPGAPVRGQGRAAGGPRAGRLARAAQGDRPLRRLPRRPLRHVRRADHRRRAQAPLPRPRLDAARPARRPGAQRAGYALPRGPHPRARLLADRGRGGRDAGRGRRADPRRRPRGRRVPDDVAGRAARRRRGRRARRARRRGPGVRARGGARDAVRRARDARPPRARDPAPALPRGHDPARDRAGGGRVADARLRLIRRSVDAMRETIAPVARAA